MKTLLLRYFQKTVIKKDIVFNSEQDIESSFYSFLNRENKKAPTKTSSLKGGVLKFELGTDGGLKFQPPPYK